MTKNKQDTSQLNSMILKLPNWHNLAISPTHQIPHCHTIVGPLQHSVMQNRKQRQIESLTSVLDTLSSKAFYRSFGSLEIEPHIIYGNHVLSFYNLPEPHHPEMIGNQETSVEWGRGTVSGFISKRFSCLTNPLMVF